MTTLPRTVSVVLFLIGLNALVWLAFGLIVALNLHPALPDLPLLKGIMALLSLVCAGVWLGILAFLPKRNRWAYFFAVGLFAVSSILSIFDDFGLIDLIFVLINLLPLVLLIKDRGWYLAQNPSLVD